MPVGRRSTGGKEKHTLILRGTLVPPCLRHLKEILDDVRRVHEHASVNGLALFVQPKHKFGDHTEIAASTADCSEEILILGFVRYNSMAIGHDNSRL